MIQWNMVRVGNGYVRVGFALGMSISCRSCQFHSRLVATANAFSGGIWVLDSFHCSLPKFLIIWKGITVCSVVRVQSCHIYDYAHNIFTYIGMCNTALNIFH